MKNIPVIDIGRLSDPKVLQQLDLACRDWGFFQVVNHGIDSALTDGVLEQAHRFFSLPQATKRIIQRSADNPWGYLMRNSPRTRWIGRKCSTMACPMGMKNILNGRTSRRACAPW